MTGKPREGIHQLDSSFINFLFTPQAPSQPSMKFQTVIVSIAVLANAVPYVFAQAPDVNATSPASPSAPSPSGHASIQSRSCIQPKGAVNHWYYNNWSNGPNGCELFGDSSEWMMLNAYRSGGQEGVHWKYTNDASDGACLTNWTYYTSDGQSSNGVIARTTTMGDTRRWCALPVYRTCGVQGKQWAYCQCSNTL